MAHDHVLLVEDTPSLARVYQEFLRHGSYQVTVAETGAAALAALDTSPLAILLDLNLPDMSGLDILKVITERRLPAAVVVITAHGSISVAVEAMRAGADDFLVKPFAPERLLTTLKNALERRRLSRIVETYGEVLAADRYCGFIGSSLAMQAVYRTIEVAAQSKASVFVIGESGTGKELCAEAIHKKSKRCTGPYVAINCAAIPRDLIESEIFGHVKGAFTGAVADREGAGARADGGTLFLDEICEMDINLQSKLLRFVQTGTFQRVGGTTSHQVDVRFVCATNRDPLKEVAAGRFREDLYYRLHVIPIHLPLLRDRSEDIVLIAEAFLRDFAREEGRGFVSFSPAARARLLSYAWPGNVRQLQNIVRQIVVLNDGPEVTLEMLPPPLADASATSPLAAPVLLQPLLATAPETAVRPAPQTSWSLAGELGIRPIAEVEMEMIERAILRCDGNITRAASLLEVSPSTLYRKRQGSQAAARPVDPSGEIVPLDRLEREVIEEAVRICSGNVPKAAALLDVSPSTIYRRRQMQA
jgi:DNA-binding NtrC family response regulator